MLTPRQILIEAIKKVREDTGEFFHVDLMGTDLVVICEPAKLDFLANKLQEKIFELATPYGNA